jgi:eukaryotic translation initiation factor 2-alpha kinase 3
MSPKYWVSSEDLSADSSLEGSRDRSREESVEAIGGEDAIPGLSTAEGSVPRGPNDRTVARTIGTNLTLPGFPSLQPQQHATLFYLSLIEGRCRTQAANTINAGRSPENFVLDNHPEVLSVAEHLFTEMRRELVKNGLIPDDLAAPTLSHLRQFYLEPFDSLLNNIATQRTFNLSAQQHSHRALPGFAPSSFNSDLVPWNSGTFVLPRTTIMAPHEQQLQQRRLSKLSLLFPDMQSNAPDKSDYTRNYKEYVTPSLYPEHWLLCLASTSDRFHRPSPVSICINESQIGHC